MKKFTSLLLLVIFVLSLVSVPASAADYDRNVRGRITVEAEVPLSEMSGYVTDLRSLTQGRGDSSMEPLKYAEVPRNIAEKIIGDRQKN